MLLTITISYFSCITITVTISCMRVPSQVIYCQWSIWPDKSCVWSNILRYMHPLYYYIMINSTLHTLCLTCITSMFTRIMWHYIYCMCTCIKLGLIIQNTLSCTLTSCLGCDWIELICKMYYLPVIKPINYIHLCVLLGKSDVVDRLTV